MRELGQLFDENRATYRTPQRRCRLRTHNGADRSSSENRTQLYSDFGHNRTSIAGHAHSRKSETCPCNRFVDCTAAQQWQATLRYVLD